MSFETRFPVGAGVHYPVESSEIEQLISDTAEPIGPLHTKKIRAAIVPSIDYQHSLPVLLASYLPMAKYRFDEIFIFSDPIMHRYENVALHPARFWETPLGRIEVSHRLSQLASSDDMGKDMLLVDGEPHEGEVSIEIQLPLIQHLWHESVRILPFIVGKSSPRLLSDTISKEVSPDDLLIVATTLSRGFPSDFADSLDDRTIRNILGLDVEYFENNPTVVSSPNSVAFLLQYAKQKQLKPIEVARTNAQPTGKVDQTVGLVSVLFVDP